MNFFLGIIPDEMCNHKIRKIVGEIGRVFDGQQIPIRWTNPDTFHVTVLFVGKDISFVKRFSLKQKMKKVIFKPFNISFKNVKLGISRRYKELVYLTVEKGDDKLRKIIEQFDPHGDIRGANSFVPHLTLGRVSKELSDEEFKNLSRDIDRMSKELNIQEISFTVTDICMIKSDKGNYDIVMNFSAS